MSDIFTFILECLADADDQREEERLKSIGFAIRKVVPLAIEETKLLFDAAYMKPENIETVIEGCAGWELGKQSVLLSSYYLKPMSEDKRAWICQSAQFHDIRGDALRTLIHEQIDADLWGRIDAISNKYEAEAWLDLLKHKRIEAERKKRVVSMIDRGLYEALRPLFREAMAALVKGDATD